MLNNWESFSLMDILLILMLVLILIGPTIAFLLEGWNQRKSEILTGLSGGNEIIKKYFDQFHPTFETRITDMSERFNQFYNSQIGVIKFMFPLMMLFAVSFLSIKFCISTIKTFGIIQSINGQDQFKYIAMFALMGAFVWVLYDQIYRWWYSDFTPANLYWASFRFIVSIPAAYSLSTIILPELKYGIAFMLGTFPTDSLFSFMRRIARQKLGLGEEKGYESELQKLDGIDFRKAERFGEENITTICQLAYSDPIKLTIRTNLGYSYLVDCISQALLWIYVKEGQPTWRSMGLRGSYELVNLAGLLISEDEDDIDQGKRLVKALSERLNVDESGIVNLVEEVAHDPYSRFLYESWSG